MSCSYVLHTSRTVLNDKSKFEPGWIALDGVVIRLPVNVHKVLMNELFVCHGLRCESKLGKVEKSKLSKWCMDKKETTPRSACAENAAHRYVGRKDITGSQFRKTRDSDTRHKLERTDNGQSMD